MISRKVQIERCTQPPSVCRFHPLQIVLRRGSPNRCVVPRANGIDRSIVIDAMRIHTAILNQSLYVPHAITATRTPQAVALLQRATHEAQAATAQRITTKGRSDQSRGLGKTPALLCADESVLGARTLMNPRTKRDSYKPEIAFVSPDETIG